MLLFPVTASAQEQPGSIRGTVRDKDFDVPLAGAEVAIVETSQTALSTEEGNFVITMVAPGKYTLVFSKEGYVRTWKSDVVVSSGQLTDVEVWMPGEFTDLDEFVVQDILQFGAGTEAALLQLRLESPSLLDSISSELMSRAGASDAASALRLVPGASIQDGKYAVIRGLPDRYVSNQLNGARMPTADENKRAVELDQFPAPVIESIQVSKTFTPDQQGDASGGAVDVQLRSIPDEAYFQIKGQLGYNSQAANRSDFLTYEGGGLNTWGKDDGGRDIQSDNLGSNWDGAVGVSEGDAPLDYKWSLDAGGKHALDNGVRIGGFLSLYYERDSSFYDDGIDDSLWVVEPGEPLSPEFSQGTPEKGAFFTSLYDVTQGSQSVQWGGLGTLGLETKDHTLGLTYLYSHSAEDVATLAEDTRGKEYYFPGYDPDDPYGAGNQARDAAPYIRLETLEYTERTTGSLQLRGEHQLPVQPFEAGELSFGRPRFQWTLARSFAELDQPDKRQFGSYFVPESFNPSTGEFNPEFWGPYKPRANANLGNLQRIWKTIEEESSLYSLELVFPFEQWSGDEGRVHLGYFGDQLEREFDQDTFSNFADAGAQFEGGWDEYWSAEFPFEDHPITASDADVDYDGDQDITAWFGLIDLPLCAPFSLIGGARLESTEIEIVNKAEEDATWFPPGATGPVSLGPGEADVSFEQDDVLPAIGLVYEPTDKVTLRASYSQTVARQTFKELTPVLQQEYAGGPVFIGNPELQMAALENYDLRLDYTPYEGGFLSLSYFGKDLEDPIEYVQDFVNFTYTTPVNYPSGEISGFEVELRQNLGRFRDGLDGYSIGANAAFIDSKVNLTPEEIEIFEELEVPMTSRDATGAPDYLYNLYLTAQLGDTTEVALFYTFQGDTLVAGAGESLGNFVPSVYAKEYGTLNCTISKILGKHFRLTLQGKNLTNPEIEEVYRSDFTGGDVTKTSYTRGVEFTLGLSARL
jgi:outer membrane receptor protein involved in Fe transport